ncbi:hypothetical protein JB92DRAFT_2135775 [Gautieria morchelliformis]|nr:hypothetical protein JB92DRAFT_2135775 [Gautieria morchelliformis]
MTDTDWLTNHAVPDPLELQDYPSSLSTPNLNHPVAPSVGFTGRTVVREVEGMGHLGMAVQICRLIHQSLPRAMPTGCANFRPPGGDGDLSRQHGEHITAATRTHSKRKRPKRIFERPPGLPFGPWTPGNMGPSPTMTPLKKPRKVKRAPATESRLTLPQGLGDKVSCPKCSTVVLATSLNRHLERHCNWAEGGTPPICIASIAFLPTPGWIYSCVIKRQTRSARCCNTIYIGPSGSHTWRNSFKYGVITRDEPNSGALEARYDCWVLPLYSELFLMSVVLSSGLVLSGTRLLFCSSNNRVWALCWPVGNSVLGVWSVACCQPMDNMLFRFNGDCHFSASIY